MIRHILTLPALLPLAGGLLLLMVDQAMWNILRFLAQSSPMLDPTIWGFLSFGSLLLFTMACAGVFLAALYLILRGLCALAANYIFRHDTEFRTRVLKALGTVPGTMWQMYDGLACSGHLIEREWPFFLYRLDLMVRRGLIETDRFHKSNLLRSYRNVPGYRLPPGAQ